MAAGATIIMMEDTVVTFKAFTCKSKEKKNYNTYSLMSDTKNSQCTIQFTAHGHRLSLKSKNCQSSFNPTTPFLPMI